MRFADDTVIIVETQVELQDMVMRLVDSRREYGMEFKIDKSQVINLGEMNHCGLK